MFAFYIYNDTKKRGKKIGSVSRKQPTLLTTYLLVDRIPLDISKYFLTYDIRRTIIIPRETNCPATVAD
jgi:hypothetical protein